MNTIYIDSSDNKKVIIKLMIGSESYTLASDARILKSQVVLPLIEKIIKQQGLKPEDIDSIKIETGPGSFTGLRVGVSIANALSFALFKPVNNKKIGDTELPQY